MYKRGWRIKFLPRGASNIHPHPPLLKNVLWPEMGGGGGAYIISPRMSGQELQQQQARTSINTRLESLCHFRSSACSSYVMSVRYSCSHRQPGIAREYTRSPQQSPGLKSCKGKNIRKGLSLPFLHVPLYREHHTCTKTANLLEKKKSVITPKIRRKPVFRYHPGRNYYKIIP